MNQLILKSPIRRWRGHCYAVDVKDVFGIGNHLHHPTDSQLFVFEDGKPLGPPHIPPSVIEPEGGGRFCHDSGTLYFSAADNSDPNTNGRVYTAALSEELYFTERYTYNRNQVRRLINELKLAPEWLRGKRVLEIGPGRDSGFGLILAGLGATTLGVEKYRMGWTQDWHSPFIDAICTNAPADFPGFDGSPLRSCQAMNGFDPAYIDFYQTSMEDFSPDKQEGFDITYSLAVLEHVADPEIVVHNLFEATKPGGLGMHGIDMRDHRNFSAPLEYLLLDERSLETEIEKGGGRYWLGNPMRSGEWQRLWQKEGFRQLEFDITESVVESYFKDFLPRLRASPSRFRNTSPEGLKAISGSFRMRR